MTYPAKKSIMENKESSEKDLQSRPKTLILNGTNFMRRLSTMQLIPGMTIAQDVFSYDHDLLLSQGTELNDKLITKLGLYGVLTVYIEDKEPPAAPVPKVSQEPSYYDRIKQSPDFQKFKAEYEQNMDYFKESINAVVERNIKLDVETLLSNSLEMISHISNQFSVLDILQNMREYDDSTFAHSMNVALISNLLATWLRFSEEGIKRATICGLLHDVGKMQIPYSIISKPGQLSDEEFEMIREHPITGYQLLFSQNMDQYICNAALQHHERYDGSGYPLHLKGTQIDRYARVVAIADVYDAMTAARCYRGPLCPFRVIELFEAEGFQKYDVEYLLPFLRNVVNTYIRNRCRLSDGREGDIIYINNDKLSRPVVQCGTEYVNLAEEPDLSITDLL